MRVQYLNSYEQVYFVGFLWLQPIHNSALSPQMSIVDIRVHTGVGSEFSQVWSQAFFDVVSIAPRLCCNLSLSLGVSAAILVHGYFSAVIFLSPQGFQLPFFRVHGYFSAGCSLASLSWAVSAASLYLHVVACRVVYMLYQNNLHKIEWYLLMRLSTFIASVGFAPITNRLLGGGKNVQQLYLREIIQY